VRRGFTLIELLIVMVVVAVIASVVVPTMMGGRDHHRVRASARILLAHARRARVDAITGGIRTQLHIDLDDGLYWAEHESDPFQAPGEFKSAAGPWGQPSLAGENVEILGVRVSGSGKPLDSDAESVQTGEAIINFLPEGSANAAQVWLAAGLNADEQLVVEIDGLTGRVRILTPEQAQAEGDIGAALTGSRR
jgi:prepilin-type N-terminal cleavage/methylation domain-containing protein